ncbi:ParB N-terminal domain-containing protein [Bradyrhizobium sp. JYMT SZCCT0428]|uniref:ParB/RepB/Spo0J family partition protein n=1 Tax=Bradyrhizobium sp. JYMT SZCCT0428 TaxID=2807673 RepID=UPI001BAC1C15|nr:ParB N-terminal domain-containing protein [Bradyrhizobium sp. JYMT SZCCT0428]MBR1150111.1 ParB N-terminal domain-containing protein [Bradyrhizobium sp. JYMT SZCCT0428]
MDLQVPLNRLKFGQDDGAGINARVAGRQDGIAELAANLHVHGQIENLIVKDAGEGFYSVANGNRRLAAFHMLYTESSERPINCTLHDVDEAKAFEFSLATAVTAKQLHPVDQYEAFVRLRDRQDKSVEEIAKQYGMSDREVEQALALGHLSPTIRDLWRKGEIKTDVAKAFTLAPDHKAQEDILAVFAERSGGIAGIEDYDVKQSLKIGDDDSGPLVEFVGIDAYVARGGKVTRDLFGTDHQVSDPKLVKAMAAERLKAECAKLVESGWSFAVTADSVRNTRYDYTRLKVEVAPTPEEVKALADLNAIFNPESDVAAGYYGCDSFAELTGVQQKAYLAYQGLERAIELRSYTPKMMASAGCFVKIDGDGFLEIEFGHVKPKQKEAAAAVVKEERKEQKKAAAKTAASEGKPAPESKVLSNALQQRLSSQLIGATRDAIATEPQLVNSPMFEALAKIICSMIDPDRPFHMPDAVRTKLPTIRQTLNAGVFNQAIAKRFDAEDYFASAPKGFVLKAIVEAINQDEARKVSTKPKADIAKFAIANLGKTGWLPKELRSVHYKGPGSEGYKRPAPMAVPAAPAPEKPASTADKVRAAKAERETKKNDLQMKRAAATKATAKKTSVKKR